MPWRARLIAVIGFLRAWWRPLLTSALLCVAVMITSPLAPLDRRISDNLLVRQQLPASSDLLIVEIGPEDMQRFGGAPLSRAALADLIDKLDRAGSRTVLLDLFLAVPFREADDARLESALARFGPGRLALVSGQNARDLPLARFARHATVVDARLTPDIDGWHRRIGLDHPSWGVNPATWLAMGVRDREPVAIDLRINPATFERISMQQALSGPLDLKGRTVMIGVSPLIAPSRAMLPLNRSASRLLVMAAATESVQRGFAAQRDKGMLANAVLALVAVALGFCWALAARNGRQFTIGLVTLGTILASLSFEIARQFAVEIRPTQTLTLFAVMVNITLVQRLRILPLMGSFLKGDISPEELWAWRSWDHSHHAAVLFGVNGQIKRRNGAAEALVEGRDKELARLCVPAWGERAELIELPDADGSIRHFALDWPFEQIQLVILRDVTEAEASQRQLEAQLLSDPLTGQANRLGFDLALVRAGDAGSGFGVLFMDMNGFKAINDAYGHDAGDEVLVITASRIARLLRPGDRLARLGGDEFAIVAPGLDSEDVAAQLGQRIAAAVGQPIRLSCVDALVSVGTAVGWALNPGSDKPIDQLLREADQAMYRNKRAMKHKAAA